MEISLVFEGLGMVLILKTKKRYRSLIFNTNIVAHNWKEVFFIKDTDKNNWNNYKFYRILIFGMVLKDIDNGF